MLSVLRLFRFTDQHGLQVKTHETNSVGGGGRTVRSRRAGRRLIDMVGSRARRGFSEDGAERDPQESIPAKLVKDELVCV